jgi:general secretion pathway protein D
MFSRAAGFLLAGSLMASLWLAAGCSSPEETMSERRRRIQAEEMGDSPTAGEEEALPVGDAAEEPQGGIGKADLAEEEPLPEEEPAPKAREKARPKARAAGADVAGGSREEQVLEDLVEEMSLERQEARYHAERGDELFGENRYEEAIQAYEKALSLDPGLDDARRRLNDALVMTGERSGEVASVGQSFADERKVQKEQRLLEINRNLIEGQKALEENDVDRAEDLVAQALFQLDLEPDIDAAKRRDAEALLKRIRNEKAARDRARESAMLRQAQENAKRDLEQEAVTRRNEVQELLRKSVEFMRVRDYEKAIEACERVLVLDPGNLVAKFWINDSKEQMVRERRQKLINDRLENQRLMDEGFLDATIAYERNFVFPDDEKWLAVQKRARETGFIDVEDSEPVRKTKNALEATRIQSFNFDATPLEDVLRQLRTVTGANITHDPAVDATAVTVTMKIENLSALSALNLILDNVGLAYTFRENVLYVTNPGQQGGNTEFAIYNVADILNKIRDFEGPELILRPSGDTGTTPISFTAETAEEEAQLDPETLATLIRESTGGEEAWAEPNSIEFHAGQFLVNAPRELHAAIQGVLENLRKDSDLFVVIEARFIDVNDDFLEDIGVEYRALGAVNNYGTPFGNIINDNSTGGQDLGFVEQGSLNDAELVMGQDRWAGRVQHILDGFSGLIRGTNLSGGNAIGGLTVQWTILEPFQVNVIIRAVQERANVRQLTAPVVTAHNGQRVFVSVITQRAYIADYNLVSGGTGFQIIEVADPEVQTFQEGVILDVDPVISHDKKYVTLDVRPTLATLINGVISTILISLGSFTSVAFMVPIGVPEIALQQSFTSVTVPNGGTVLLGGFKSLNEAKYKSYIPILGQIPIVNSLFRRQATLSEKRSLVILLSVRIVDLRGEEDKLYNPQ